MKIPNIMIFALGGTILMTGDSQIGVKPNLSANDLIMMLDSFKSLSTQH